MSVNIVMLTGTFKGLKKINDSFYLFTLVEEYSYKNKQGELIKNNNFHNCNINYEPPVNEGQKIAVEGSLSYYKDDKGAYKSVIRVKKIDTFEGAAF